jgi:hypothetical protein
MRAGRNVTAAGFEPAHKAARLPGGPQAVDFQAKRELFSAAGRPGFPRATKNGRHRFFSLAAIVPDKSAKWTSGAH